jgi:FKBP-type peptidyl-prolyl cis-trans isomerase
MMRIAPALAALLLTAPLAAQDAPETAPEPKAEPKTGVGSMAWHSQQQAYPSSLKAEDGWHWMEGGLRWRWTEYNASEKRPSLDDNVTVHYEGTFLDGKVFDSSFERGEPATFPLGRLVKGWQMAIPNMGVGETIEIVIPPDLAYGPEGRGPIPGGATLKFKVQLIAIAEE